MRRRSHPNSPAGAAGGLFAAAGNPDESWSVRFEPTGLDGRPGFRLRGPGGQHGLFASEGDARAVLRLLVLRDRRP